MSNTKHTPGPWHISPHCKNEIRATNRGSLSAPITVASANFTKSKNIISVSNWDEAEANAKLIAAAPDLLAYIIELKERFAACGHINDVADCERIIKKATE